MWIRLLERLAALATFVILHFTLKRSLQQHSISTHEGTLGQDVTGLSMKESFGFINESDVNWQRRAIVHKAQMEVQHALTGRCDNCPAPQWYTLHYEPSFSCAFERRMGQAGDGGKWVCNPHRIAELVNAGQPCLVYSIGSNGNFVFENAVHAAIPGCEIHTFDINPWQRYQQKPPSFIQYHVAKVGPQRNLPHLVRELGHTNRTIQIMKIDCEGCERSSVSGWFAPGIFVQQIQVEYHFGSDLGLTAPAMAHKFFRFLMEQGFVIFHKEANLQCPRCMEYGLLHLSRSFR